jgi:hypothetical protein
MRIVAVVLLLSMSSAIACGGAAPTTPPGGSGGLPATLSPITTPPLPPNISVMVRGMLQSVAIYIVAVYAEMQANRPRNPHLEVLHVQRLTMLADPTLIQQIFNGRRWAEGTASTVRGVVPIAALFPAETMRGDCSAVVQRSSEYVPILVEFFDQAFSTNGLLVWCGFKIGASGGGGAIYVEDRATYEGRSTPTALHYDLGIAHELAHTFMGNEALTQFLEVYTYNVANGAGLDPLDWPARRGWAPDTPTTFGVTHVLDIYHRVGFDTMRRAFRAVWPLRPAYGQPLSAAVIAAFLAEVPEEHRDYVQAKLAAIIA